MEVDQLSVIILVFFFQYLHFGMFIEIINVQLEFLTIKCVWHYLSFTTKED